MSTTRNMSKPKRRKKQQIEPEHSENGPSQLRAIELCAHYVDKQRDQDAADEGTRAHAYLEKHLPNGKHNQKELDTFTEDMQEHIVTVWDYMLTYFFKEGLEDYDIQPEQTVDLKPCNIPKCEKGTVDVVAFPAGQKEFCKAADYKMGFIEVDDPENNIQTWMYAVGLFFKYPDLTEIEFEIIQPKANTIGTHTYYREDMARFISRAAAIVEAKENKDQVEPTPNIEYCRYCALLGTCEKAQNQFKKFPEKLELKYPDKKHWEDKNTNSDSAAAVFAYCKALEKAAKAVCDDISFSAKTEGLEVTNYRLKERKGNSYVIDLLGIKEYVIDEYGISEEEYALAQKPSLTKLKTLIRDKAPRGEKKESENEFMESLRDGAYIDENAPASWLERIKD